MTFGVHSVQHKYCDSSRRYMNIKFGLPGGGWDEDNTMGMGPIGWGWNGNSNGGNGVETRTKLLRWKWDKIVYRIILQYARGFDRKYIVFILCFISMLAMRALLHCVLLYMALVWRWQHLNWPVAPTLRSSGYFQPKAKSLSCCTDKTVSICLSVNPFSPSHIFSDCGKNESTKAILV